MININEVMETNAMIREENLDVRTITMGISLLDCISDDLKTTCDKVYDHTFDVPTHAQTKMSVLLHPASLSHRLMR